MVNEKEQEQRKVVEEKGKIERRCKVNQKRKEGGCSEGDRKSGR